MSEAAALDGKVGLLSVSRPLGVLDGKKLWNWQGRVRGGRRRASRWGGPVCVVPRAKTHSVSVVQCRTTVPNTT